MLLVLLLYGTTAVINWWTAGQTLHLVTFYNVTPIFKSRPGLVFITEIYDITSKKAHFCSDQRHIRKLRGL